MRIKAEQLGAQLNNGLLPVYLISGEEPLLTQELIDELRIKARSEGYDERKILNVERGFDWNELLEGADALSLFASRKIIELKLPTGKPGTEGSKALASYLEHPPEDTLLFIEAGRIDKKTLEGSKWCKAIDKVGGIIQVWPVKPEEMFGFMRQRARKLKLDIDKDALELLSSRLEGNLLAAKQELDKLKLLHGDGKISVGMIFDEVKDSARYDVFDLCKSMLGGKPAQTCNILHHLKHEGTEPTYALWAIGKELRTLSELMLAQAAGTSADQFYKKNRIFRNQQGDFNKALGRSNLKSIQTANAHLKRADDAIKGAPEEPEPWQLIEKAVLALNGVQL